jgi:hypothetical protein
LRESFEETKPQLQDTHMAARKTKSKPEPKAHRHKPDWEAIESQYRAGILSLRAVATQFGIAEGAIRKKAKAKGWQRDLDDNVRKAEAAQGNPLRKPKTGGKSTYSLDQAKKICAWIAAGKSLVSYCKQPGSPGLATVYEWRVLHPELAEMYARAREDQADALADELLDIADNSELDHNDRRIKIDTRKWIASKLKPRAYGDKVHNEVSGELSFAQIIVSRYRPPGGAPA